MDLKVLRNLTYGMYIISTSFNNVFAGCIVNTVTQITSSNPILVVSINKNNYTNKILKESKKVAISILNQKANQELISTFGYFSSIDINKFANVDYEKINEIPVVKTSCNSYILGVVINIIDVETHDIFLVRVTDAKILNNEKVMTYDFYHTNMKGTSPKNAPTYQEESKGNYNKYRCIICRHIYDEELEKIKFEDLPDDWRCPICGVTKDKFEKVN